MPEERGDQQQDRPDPEVVAYLGREGIEVSAAAGELLVRRGEQGLAFWVVLEGTVEVRLSGEDGVRLPLARMGAGSTFGEMSLITGDPVSADVAALTAVRLLRYPAERFSRALGECAPLRTLVLARLAENLRGASAEAWNFHQQARALSVLMGPRRETGPIVAESGAMKAVRDLVARRGLDIRPFLVGGEPGTGKHFLAAKVHEAAGPADSPFIAVDCRTLDPAAAMRFLLGSGTASDFAGRDRPGGLRRYGALQLAHGGTLVLRHVEVLPRAVQDALGEYLCDRAAGAVAYPLTRIAATTDLDQAAFAAAAAPALAELAGEAIAVPSLRERRRDILPLARRFLAEHATQGGAPASELDGSAERALLSQRFIHRNAAELREAIDMAAVIADGPRIQAEHIFTGPKGKGTIQEVDLSRFPLVGRLTAPGVIGALRAGVFAVFAAITGASLLLPEAPAGRVANALTWGLWEPALFVLFLLVGRVWCTVCPLSTAGRLAARLGSLGRSPGAWLKSSSVWLISGGFLLVIWSEHAFGMRQHPRAAGVLLLALFAAAVASAVVWRREAWCRYLCPLGNLGAVFSLPAVLTVRSNPSVCATMCTTHECFKGSGTQPGCPVYHHPLYANEAHACKQCYQCLRVCPHGSARLWLRLPLQSVWAQSDIGGALVPFALFLFFFAPAMLATQGRSWAATLSGFTATALVALAAAFVVSQCLPRFLAAGSEPSPSLSTRVAFALVVLAWGPAMAFQLGHIGALEALRLHAAPGSPLAAALPEAGLPLLTLARVAAVLVAAVLAAICFAGIRGRLRFDRETSSRAGWRTALLVSAAYAAGSLVLAAGR